MKKFIKIIIAFCAVLLLTNGSIFADTGKHIVRFVEKVKDYNQSFSNERLQSKSTRVLNKRGNLVLLYDSTLPDSVKTALNAAKEIWEAKVPNKVPVRISVVFEPSESDMAMLTEVIYFESPAGCPSSLASQLNARLVIDDSPDAIIVFNSNLNWNCDLSGNINVGYNITTMVLRGFALSFGFGTGIHEENNSLVYDYVGPTFFDKLLKRNSTGTFLTSYAPSSTEFNNFITSDDVCVTTSNGNYSLYAPTEYEPYKSLRYFKEDNSLMSYSLGMGNSFLRIDDATINVLNEIGWDIPESGFGIICSDISSDGIGTAYSMHTFFLDNVSGSASNLEWSFKLKKANGEFTVVSTGSGNSFTIDEIVDYEGYLVDQNGNLKGTIECNYSVDGNIQDAKPLELSLELKPIIFSIEKQIQYNSDYSYNAILDINYAGSYYVTVEVEEEYDSAVRSYRVDEPYTAHLQTGKITALYDSWITVRVKNQYGTASEIFYFPPNYSFYNESSSDIEFVLNDIKYDYTVSEKDGDWLDCVGKLSFSIPIAEDVSFMILSKTIPRYPADKEIRFHSKLPIDIEPSQTVVNFQQDGIYWGTYFQMAYFMNDGSIERSPIYCTNSYISSDDLYRLTESASVTEIEPEDCGFSYNSTTRTLKIDEGASVEFFDITGRVIFRETGEQNISLSHLQGKYVIIRCVFNNGIYNKKLIL